MIINIKEPGENKSKNICIPRVCISLGIFVLPLALKSMYRKKNNSKTKVAINNKEMKNLKKAIKYLNKNYKGLVLVDIKTNEGESVKIVI
ncbi:MAG: hypothetical protein E7215_02765 [Clostridium sulfidigenes]|uniref:Uncharacterized protein n=1 Tax=Clostridium sulfidigenes TaxID=318464 RepID=A0A927W6L2_9CLOT|nr:hypothetical protein [Clostridium sulfidigenes]